MAVHTGTALPPGASESEFDRALTALTNVVGAENVYTSDGLAEHEDPYSFSEPGAYAPAAAVLPASVEEVQAVVAVAGEHKIPLWTVSRGRNFGYGGAAPRVRGSVVVNLSRLNRVLGVDEDAAYAVVEPGISFADLHQHLRDTGSLLWVDVPELSWGSVIGNALERGFGYSSAADHSAHICGMEVEEYGFDYAGGFTTFPRHAIALALVSFDKSDPEQTAAVRRLFPDLVADATAAGYASYRAHVAFMDLIADPYDWGDHAARHLQQTIKDAVDPLGILSPGKQGIWPAHQRQ